jgi:hypothetical protein
VFRQYQPQCGYRWSIASGVTRAHCSFYTKRIIILRGKFPDVSPSYMKTFYNSAERF